MIEKLVTWVVSQDPVEVRFDFLDNDQWAIVTMHIYEEDKEISLRLHTNDFYDLYFGYYDDDDELEEREVESEMNRSYQMIEAEQSKQIAP